MSACYTMSESHSYLSEIDKEVSESTGKEGEPLRAWILTSQMAGTFRLSF